MQPQTMTEPPPCFTVGARQSMWYRSPGLRRIFIRPSLWKRLKRDSSEGTISFHFPSHFSRSRHHAGLASMFFSLRSGFLHAIQLRNPALATYFRTVSLHRVVPSLAFTSLVIACRGRRRPSNTTLFTTRWSRLLSFSGPPGRGLGCSEPVF